MYEQFGQIFKKERKRQGLTAKDIQDLTGISYNHIYQIESGIYKDIHFSTLEKMLDGIGCQIKIVRKCE